MDIEAIKSQFPIFASQRNLGYELHYLDNAATAHKPQSVIDAISQCYSEVYAPVERGIYPLAEQATMRYVSARQTVADFIGADASGVCFTKGTTESLNMVAQSAVRQRLSHGDEIWVSDAEHHANFLPWLRLCHQTGATLRRIPIDPSGRMQLPDVTRAELKKVKCVSLSLVSNVLGFYCDLDELAGFLKQLRSEHVLTVIDAAQAAAHMPIEVADLHCDFMAFSGHKMYGPTGIGVLYIAPEQREAFEPFLLGGGMVDWVGQDIQDTQWRPGVERFEAGTPNLAGASGLTAAVQFIQAQNRTAVKSHVARLGEHCGDAIAAFDNVSLLSEASAWRAGIVTFAHHAIHPHDLAQVCADNGVAVRAGHHCAQPLMQTLGYDATVRVSFTLYNDERDIQALLESLREAESVFT